MTKITRNWQSSYNGQDHHRFGTREIYTSVSVHSVQPRPIMGRWHSNRITPAACKIILFLKFVLKCYPLTLLEIYIFSFLRKNLVIWYWFELSDLNWHICWPWRSFTCHSSHQSRIEPTLQAMDSLTDVHQGNQPLQYKISLRKSSLIQNLFIHNVQDSCEIVLEICRALCKVSKRMGMC